ncbi:MAG: hypothetical protein GOV00_00430 [Candidatus Altiarchaeota archaeon]|nr:hypothetical protein [Candidatus Altiarchaeota archaeon]
MTICKKCKAVRSWNHITTFSEVFHISLYQCSKCMRVVEFDTPDDDDHYGHDRSNPNSDYSYTDNWVEEER